MTVPQPLAHWTLGQAKGTAFNTDIINGYLLSFVSSSGSGAIYEDTGKAAGETCITNRDNSNNAYDDYNFTGSILSAMSGDLGTLSMWVKINEQDAFNQWIELTYDFDGSNRSQRQYVVQFETSAAPYNIRLQWGSKTPASGTFTYNNDVSSISPTTIDDEWVLFTLVWNATKGYARLYIIDTLAAEVTITPAVTTTDFIESDNLGYLSSPIYGLQDASLQNLKVWDRELTVSQIGELATLTPARTCARTIPLKELRTMWRDIEATLPCRATLQRSTLLGFSTFETNVPCSIELTGTRQELNSSNTYETIQNWVVTLSGRITLPSIGVSDKVRVLVNDLVLESYDYYQSPDNLQTVIECQLI
jgi:hypothetical protein